MYYMVNGNLYYNDFTEKATLSINTISNINNENNIYKTWKISILLKISKCRTEMCTLAPYLQVLISALSE